VGRGRSKGRGTGLLNKGEHLNHVLAPNIRRVKCRQSYWGGKRKLLTGRKIHSDYLRCNRALRRPKEGGLWKEKVDKEMENIIKEGEVLNFSCTLKRWVGEVKETSNEEALNGNRGKNEGTKKKIFSTWGSSSPELVELGAKTVRRSNWSKKLEEEKGSRKLMGSERRSEERRCAPYERGIRY